MTLFLRARVALLSCAAVLVACGVLGLGVSEAHAAKPSAEPVPAQGVININTASEKELGWLPSIGPSRAARVVAYRAKRPFKKVTWLARVRGIGLKTVRRLKPWLRVSGETTLKGPVRAAAAPAKSPVIPASAPDEPPGGRR